MKINCTKAEFVTMIKNCIESDSCANCILYDSIVSYMIRVKVLAI